MLLLFCCKLNCSLVCVALIACSLFHCGHFKRSEMSAIDGWVVKSCGQYQNIRKVTTLVMSRNSQILQVCDGKRPGILHHIVVRWLLCWVVKSTQRTRLCPCSGQRHLKRPPCTQTVGPSLQAGGWEVSVSERHVKAQLLPIACEGLEHVSKWAAHYRLPGSRHCCHLAIAASIIYVFMLYLLCSVLFIVHSLFVQFPFVYWHLRIHSFFQ